MKNTALFFLALFSFSAYARMTTESELGFVQSGGNAEIQTTNAKSLNYYKWDKYKSTFGGHYTYGETADSVTVRNWDVNAKVEQDLSSRMAVFVGEVVEGNTFIGIRGRYNTDIGLKYYFIKSDLENLFTELGYRYAMEDRYLPYEDTYDNKGRLYNEYHRKVSETFQYTLWLEYIPNYTEGSDYLINGEASITSILTSIFSLKLSYKGMYDNLPATPQFKNYDSLITTALVAKF